YVNGQLNGTWTEYYPHKKMKKLAAAGKMVDGKKFGRWCYYHENGQLESEGEYANDRPVGIWKFYSRYGALVEKAMLP
ncbi:MAG: hypothetical protein MI784_11565, partial [Cytophagales bacterium]|nr:hypothetical protein [Cytophagales bacterium]